MEHSHHLLQSPFQDIDPGIRDSYPLFKAIYIQREINKQLGIKDPPSFEYALKTKEIRELRRNIKAKGLPNYLRDVAEEKALRIFIPENEFFSFGDKTKRVIKRLARGLDPNTNFGENANRDYSAKDYFNLLLANKKLSYCSQNLLSEIQHGNTNQGPGLGPTNERRAALALSIISDKGFIDGFRILGEAGKPVRMKSDILESEKSNIDYGAHEEAMAVDILVHANSKQHNFYVPIQIKSSGACGYDMTKRYLSFTESEKDKVAKLCPETKKLFSPDFNRDCYRLRVERKILKIALNDRKLVKNTKRDFEPDVVNKLMAMIEYAQDQGEILITEKPYSKYDYVDKVILMIKSGFITPIEPDGRFLRINKNPIVTALIDLVTKLS